MEYEYSYLIHSSKGTSWSKKDHKYISKEKINGKWRYIYKMAEKAVNDSTKDFLSKKNKERELNYRINGKKAAVDAINKNRFNKKVKEITDYNKSLVSKQNQINNREKQKTYKKREESARIQGNTFQKSLIKNPIKLTAMQKQLKDKEMDYRINGRKKLDDAAYNKSKARLNLSKELKDYPFKYKKKKTSKEEDMRIISQNYYRTSMNNPAWEEDSYAYAYNCAASSLAYYMRRKGLDVLPNRAKKDKSHEEWKAGGTTLEQLNWFKDLYSDSDVSKLGNIRNTSNLSSFEQEERMHNNTSFDHIKYYRLNKSKNIAIKETEKFKEKKKDYCINTIQDFKGDIGFVDIDWKNNKTQSNYNLDGSYYGGHVIIWEKEGDDVIFRDCQTGKVMKNNQIREYTDRAYNIVLIDPKGYKLDPSIIYWLKNEGK